MSTPQTQLDLTSQEGRYHRQELISWWDQSRLRTARVLIVGAGALGNEIVKGLSLVGVGRVEVVDMDRVEHTNLARCVLFRDGDEGRFKAEVACAAASDLNPNVTAIPHTIPVQRLGTGYLAEFDLVVAGLDNREARLWTGQACRKLGMTWIDGAIEGLRGLARVFLPEGACYDCTLGETDREILSRRRACALLSPEDMLTGKVPTNATTASVIAGIEVQEAIKILSGRPDLLALSNSALMYTGEVLDTYHVRYDEDPYCLSHDRYQKLLVVDADPSTTLAALLDEGRERLGRAPDALELEDDLVVAGRCPECGTRHDVFRVRSALGAGDGACECGAALALEAQRSFGPADPLLALELGQLDLPAVDVVTVRSGTDRVHFSVDARGTKAG